MDASVGKATILDYSEWILDHKSELSPDMAGLVFRALSRTAPPGCDVTRKLAIGLLEGEAAPLLRRTTPKSERAWLLESLGDLVAAGTIDADSLAGVGRRKVKLILKDTASFIRENGSSPSVEILLSACRKATLQHLAVRPSGRHKANGGKRAI